MGVGEGCGRGAWLLGCVFIFGLLVLGCLGDEVLDGWGLNYGSRWGYCFKGEGLVLGCVLFVLICGDRVLVFNNEVI